VALNAMKCYIPKPIIRNDKSVQKTLKFADSLEYSACKGYNKPSSPRPSDCSPMNLDIIGSEHGVAAGNSRSNVTSDDGPLLDNNSSESSGLDGLKQVVEEIADRVWRCNRCLSFKHDTIDCSNQIRCWKCYKYGHIRHNYFGNTNQNRVLVVKNKLLASDTAGSESLSKGAVSPSHYRKSGLLQKTLLLQPHFVAIKHNIATISTFVVIGRTYCHGLVWS
jgi:hypothetical protein